VIEDESLMKTGMNLLLWTTEITPEHDRLLEQIKELGFDSVELPVFAVDNRAPYERLGKRLQSLELRSTAVTVMSPEANPIAADAAIRKAAVAHLDKVLDCCQAFGCEILCGPIHSAIGHFSGQGPTQSEFDHGVDTLRQVADRAQTRGIRLAVEYLNRFENYFLTTAADTAKFVRAVNHPSLKMMYDSFHAHIEEKNQARAFGSCASEVIHIHVSENDRGIPGTGQVNWDGFFSALMASGYDGFLTIEAFGRALPALAAATKVWRDLFPDPIGLCRDGLAFIKKQAEPK
jgi:D-psicose/D-tagatose/L-ribulose 3-epimerase